MECDTLVTLSGSASLHHRDAGRVAFLRPCILNSLFYAARNELEKIGGLPPLFLNGVVTSGDALLFPAMLERHIART